jgi:acetate kinase
MAARNKLLVLNAGSSSLKFKLYELVGAAAGGSKLQPTAAGLCERVADPAGGAVMRVGCRL